MAVKADLMAKLPPLTRLSEPEFEPEAARAYEAAIQALEAAGVAFLLGGTVALNAHVGIWRDTKDLDLFVKPEDAQRALEALAERGFATELVYESWLGKGWQGDHFVDVIWRNANGLFPVEDSWFGQGASVHVFGRDVPVIPLEELLVSKMMVMGRYRFDGADILHILFSEAEKVDWEKLARICGEHIGLMLAHLHLFQWAYPGWRDKVPEHVIEQYGRLARERPSSFGPFRARLVDIQSFEVDVQEWGMPDPHRKALESIFGDARGRQ